MGMDELTLSAAMSAFRRAIDLAGGQEKFSALVGPSQSAISRRLAAEKPLWAEQVLAVEAATGVSRYDLRPDIYPREESPAQPPAGENRPAGGSSHDDGEGQSA